MDALVQNVEAFDTLEIHKHMSNHITISAMLNVKTTSLDFGKEREDRLHDLVGRNMESERQGTMVQQA